MKDLRSSRLAIPSAVLAGLFATGSTSHATFDVDFYDWYSAKLTNNGVIKHYVNGQPPNPSLPSWFTVSSPTTSEANVQLTSGTDHVGSTYIREGEAVLKWKAYSESAPIFNNLKSEEEALAVDDGRIRIYLTMNNVVANEDVDGQLYSPFNVLLTNSSYVASDPGAKMFIDTQTPQEPGTYKLYLKPDNGLRKLTNIYFDGTTRINLNVSLLWGDINDDNVVTQSDLDIINHWLGTDSNSGQWSTMDEFTEYSAEDCDLNDDLVVNGTDYAMALLNLGVTGD